MKHSKYAKLFEEFGKAREEAGIDHNWRDVLDDGDGDDDPSERRRLARAIGLPARIALVANVSALVTALEATISRSPS